MSTTPTNQPAATKTADPKAQVATKPASPKKTFQEFVDSPLFKEQLALALPKHLTPERFIRVLMTATIKAPLLLQCTQESLFKGVFDAAAAGLELDGRRAHLIPFKNNKKNCYEATLIPDYKGIAELVMRSGIVSSIHADLVCENDVFDYDSGELKSHKIDFKKDRGEPYAYYVLVRMKDGGKKVEVMSKPEVDRIRRRSKSPTEGPWATDYDAMALKTCFKRASKWLPLSPEIRNVVDNEDDPVDRAANVTPGKTLAGLIGAPGADAPTMGADGSIEKAPENDEAGPVAKSVDVKSYSPEERKAHLEACQSAMLDAKVSEAKVMLYVHQNRMAREGQDELGTLDTAVLEGLKVIIPTLAAPAVTK